MAYITRHRVSLNVTVSADASQTFRSPVLTGYLLGFVVEKSTNVALATDCNIVLTGGIGGQTLCGAVTATNTSGTVGQFIMPRAAYNEGSIGTASAIITATGAGMGRLPFVANEPIAIQVTSAGAATNFSTDNYIHLYVDGGAVGGAAPGS